MEIASPQSGAVRAHYAFRPDIEGLRALAVLMVVFYHYGLKLFLGGFVGVDVFFVISGYLITGILFAQIDEAGSLDALRFYGRRARRLLPAACLVTIVTLIGASLISAPLEQRFWSKSAVFSSAYVSNYWFMIKAGDYFASDSATNPFLHTWSLAVEEQFYLAWPALIIVSANLGKYGARFLILAFSLASLAVCAWLSYKASSVAFYSSPTRVWEFGLGAAAGWVPVQAIKRFAVSISITGLILIGLGVGAAGGQATFPGWIAIIPTTGAALMLIGGSAGGLPLLATRPFLWTGQRSYSIYLWHWPVIVLAGVLVGELSLVGRIACGLLTLVVAAASYALFEQPIRANKYLARFPLRSLAVGIGFSMAAVLISGLSFLQARAASLSREQKQITAAAQQVSLSNRAGCINGYRDSVVKPCRFGSGRQVIALFGDSHADHWSTPLAAFARSHDWTIVTFLKSACAAVDVPVYSTKLRRSFDECRTWRARAMQNILALHPTAVVIGQYSAGYIASKSNPMGVSPAAWQRGLRSTVQNFAAAGLPAIVLRDTPFFPVSVPTCLGRAVRRGSDAVQCGGMRSAILDSSIAGAERVTVERYRSAHYIDPNRFVCGRSFCPPMIAGKVVYRDDNHLSYQIASTLSDKIGEAIEAALNSAR